MKIHILCVLVMSCAGFGLQAQTSAIMRKFDLTSQVCFVPPEVNGRMNIEKSKVTFSNDQELTLMGGQAACLYVTPGEFSFRIEFLDSEGMFGRRSKSPEYRVDLVGDDRVVYEVYPTANGPSYTGGWRVRIIDRHVSKK